MRRLVQHALVGMGVTALTVGAAMTGVGGADQQTLIAVPAPTTSVSVPAASPDPDGAEPAAPQAEQERGSAGAPLSVTLAQASKRSEALQQQSRSITRQQGRIKVAQQAKTAARKERTRAAKAEAAAAAARAAAARAAAEERAAEKRAAAQRTAQERAAARAAAEQAARQRGYAAGTTDPRDMAQQILQNKFGYGAGQYDCFNNVIIRESNWDVDATNPSSGAYGIPQALPGSKMASAGSDWRTNPATQITWAVGYMNDRYGSPCQAWTFKRANGWY